MFKNQRHIVYRNTLVLRFRKTALALALSQILALSAPVALAATITVDTDSGGANDPNQCTLRDAITAANTDAMTGGCSAGAGADTIILPSNATITLTEPDNPDNGLPVVTSSITIEGNGSTIKRNSDSPRFRIFEANNGLLEFRNTIISGGYLDSYDRGGGIYARNSPVTLTNSMVSENSVQYGMGSGIASDNSVTLTNSTVSQNHGSRGISGESVLLINSTVSKNGSGGVFGRAVTLINSIVSSNTAGGGGGISGRSVTLINSTVSGNSAYYYGGGGISAVSLVLINSTVSGNSADYDGGGGISSGSVELINSTVSGNSAPNGKGGGIYIDRNEQQGNNLLIQNSIIANNSGGDCANDGGATPTGINNLIGDSGVNCGTPLLTGDPKLGPLQNNGGPTPTHALLADSPAIDAGDDTICATLPKNARDRPTDQRGRSRAGPRAGSHCDIGAYELRTQVARDDGQ